MKEKTYYVYILTNGRNTVFYTGVTDDLIRRNAEHKHGVYAGFTKKHGVHKLVYFETHTDYATAAHREKQIKRWKRAYKINVINKMNPGWRDLFAELTDTEFTQSPFREMV